MKGERPALPRYDAGQVARFFDAYGEREWDRLARDPHGRVSFELHRRYLERFIRPGDRVLEIGAGPGRFTIELARLGARVVVSDISPGQLELNRQRVTDGAAEQAVVERTLIDVLDLSRFADDAFDATVSYGGPLSYVLEHADRAVTELLRVTTPGGYLLCSVMSLIGSARASLAGLFELVDRFDLETVDREVKTGNISPETANGQAMRLYRWSELKDLLERHSATLVAASAANCLSVGNDEVLERVATDTRLWSTFLEWEVSACAQPGALDGGTHIIAVAQKPS